MRWSPIPARKTAPAVEDVRDHGYIEIGDQETFGLVVRAIGDGGLDFDND